MDEIKTATVPKYLLVQATVNTSILTGMFGIQAFVFLTLGSPFLGALGLVATVVTGLEAYGLVKALRK